MFSTAAAASELHADVCARISLAGAAVEEDFGRREALAIQVDAIAHGSHGLEDFATRTFVEEQALVLRDGMDTIPARADATCLDLVGTFQACDDAACSPVLETVY